MNPTLPTAAFLEAFEGELNTRAAADILNPLREAYLEAGLNPYAADEAALADYLCGFALVA